MLSDCRDGARPSGSELVGMEKRVDEVERESRRHDTAEDEVEHGVPQARPAQAA